MTDQPNPNRTAPGDQEVLVESLWDTKKRAYRVAITLDGRTYARLDARSALAHAAAVLAHAQHAEYDAAVLTQLHTLGLPIEAAGESIAGLRDKRRVPSAADTAPLRLEPGVTTAGKPFIAIKLHGEPVGQWDIPDARAHAMYVMEAVEGARLDTDYRNYLVQEVGLDDNRASQVVHGLADHRPPYAGKEPRP
jgi:hypothetical protein